MSVFSVNIEPGSGILGTYKNQSYKLESAFAEFIDNSTQSFFFNRNALLDQGQKSCKITIEIFPEYIRILDNAYGMEIDDFRRAMKLNSPPNDKSGRCEKGMGLKTAATCLGSFWTVTTTELGSDKKYKCSIDVDEIAINSPESIEALVETCGKDEHFTEILIERLNKKISEKKIQALISSLSQMYSKDILNGDLVLIINKTLAKYESPELRLDPDSGSEYFDIFDRTFELEGQKYHFDGWVGIRKTGDSEFSGFTLFRKGRAIKIHYRPTKLLGKPNLYPYQRIIGEVNLLGDNWEPSYTKDELMWEGELEDKFISELKIAASSMISLSSSLRKEEKPLTEEKKKAISAKTNKVFQQDNSNGIDITPSQDPEMVSSDNKQVDNTTTSLSAQSATVSNDLPQATEPATDLDRICTVIQGVNYTFWVKWTDNDYDDWLKLNICNENNEFNVCINYGLPYFGDHVKTQKELELIQKMAITVAASIVAAKNNGDKESYRTLSIINSIIKHAK